MKKGILLFAASVLLFSPQTFSGINKSSKNSKKDQIKVKRSALKKGLNSKTKNFKGYRAPTFDGRVIDLVKKVVKKGEKNKNFSALYKITKKLKAKSVPGLVEVARNSEFSGEARWVSIMELARIGGVKSLPFITKLLSDKNWMVRAASIQSIAGLDAKPYWKDILPKLKDPALIVRIHAVDAMGMLKAKESGPYLVKEFNAKRNMHRGKGLWIQKHILKALVAIKHKPAVKDLKSFSKRKSFSDIKGDIQKSITQIQAG